MLVQLKINNYLLIEKLELEFYSGLTVVTGETGSGKSIIIDALMLVFGARASRDIVRLNTMAASFEAVFQINNVEAKSWLRENDLLDLDNPESVICRRTIDNQGKSKIQINGHSVTALQIRTLGDYVLDIHTQHASITLLKPEIQRNLLDQFCATHEEVNRLAMFYRQIQDIEAKLKQANSAMRDIELRRQILDEQVRELSELGLQEGQWDRLQDEHKQLNNAQEILSELDYSLNLIINNEGSLSEIVNNLQLHLNKVSSYVPKLSDALKIVDSIDIELRELSHEINQVVKDINQDPDRLTEIEARMDEIFSLSRKYRIDPVLIPEALVRLEEELVQLDQGSDINKLEEQLATLHGHYNDVAQIISAKRKAGAAKLAKAVTQLLPSLAISGKFEIALPPTSKLTAYGLETIEYQVSFNQGVPLQALSSAASGGELSRVALALYLLLSMHNPPQTIIFDEIDVGIGGKVAAVVGQMLAKLGSDKQVVCITHQPQAASFGANHLVVTKAQTKGTTVTKVDYVQGEERIAEVARMLGGVNITNATITHAKEMLEQHKF